MGLRLVAISLLLSLAASCLAQAQYFRASPFAARQRKETVPGPGAASANSFAASAVPSDQGQSGEAADDDILYRTLCVRLCDGYYFPISFSTPASGFARDTVRCTASCGRQARLFYHANPGGSVETMMDLAGRPYSALPAAFKYRATLVSGCGCHRLPASEDGGEDLARDRDRQPSKATLPRDPGAWPDRPLLDAEAALMPPAPEATEREMPAQPSRSRRPAWPATGP
jgi:Protein of unknown function (DUF2865)